MLHAIEPLSAIVSAIDPPHFAVALPHVPLIPTRVDVPRRPAEDAFPRLLVVLVVALILVRLPHSPLPDSPSVPQAVHELPAEETAVGPEILSAACRFAVRVLALVDISVGELLDALPMLQALLELSLVAVPVGRNQHSLA